MKTTIGALFLAVLMPGVAMADYVMMAMVGGAGNAEQIVGVLDASVLDELDDPYYRFECASASVQGLYVSVGKSSADRTWQLSIVQDGHLNAGTTHKNMDGLNCSVAQTVSGEEVMGFISVGVRIEKLPARQSMPSSSQCQLRYANDR